MKYIILCGGQYDKWTIPKHLTQIKGESIVQRTIRLLRECGVTDIAISSNNPQFYENMGVPIITHQNNYRLGLEKDYGDWLDAFCPIQEPTCYIYGDVVFSKEAIQKIIDTETTSIEFFASAPPFEERYCKPWAEPFAYKVVNISHFFESIEMAKKYEKEGCFYRKPVSWELWQVIKGTPLGKIDYSNYTVINDYTCDIDSPEDVELIERYVE